MTALSPTPRGRWVRAREWAAHHPLVIGGSVIGTWGVAYFLLPDGLTASLLKSLGSLAAIVIQWLTIAHDHRSHLCLRCMTDMPADPGAAIERDRPALRAFHRLYNSWVGPVVYIVVLAACYVPGFIGWTAIEWLWVVPIVVMYWLGHRHRMLQPWCPWCRGWEDGGDHEVSPTPDPTGSKTGPVTR